MCVCVYMYNASMPRDTQWPLRRNFVQENDFDNVVCNMTAIVHDLNVLVWVNMIF